MNLPHPSPRWASPRRIDTPLALIVGIAANGFGL